MAKGKLFDLLKNVVDNVQQNNREQASQKTAPAEVFDRLRNEFETIQDIRNEKQEDRRERREERREERQERRAERRVLKSEIREQKKEMRDGWREEGKEDPFDAIRKKIEAMKQDNESRQDEETADPQVWDQLLKEVSQLESIPATEVQYKYQPQNPQTQQTQPVQEQPAFNPFASSGAAPIGNGVIMAQGSINVNAEPSMNAQRSNFRIPQGAIVNLLAQDNTNPVNLDGNQCGWCKVHYEGQEGWILDAYLGSV